MHHFHEIFISFITVALSEMGDKTQLLAFTLAAKFKKPLPVLGGIVLATIINHLLAAWLGNTISAYLSEQVLAAVLTISFFAFAIWVLFPDRDNDTHKAHGYGPFLTTAVLFFLAEMGDKTQLATLALAARFHEILWVTVGTTLGMIVSDGLAVFLGKRLTHQLEMRWVRYGSSGLFFLFALFSLGKLLKLSS
jgi:putative Ca2+/H+ antiporter (TMEM165/GDT1 family)